MTSAGIGDVDIWISNMLTIVARQRAAAAAGFFIEAKTYCLDALLVVWLLNMTDDRSYRRDVTFGRRIEQAEKAGFAPDLIQRLKRFNETVRIPAVHLLLRSDTPYEQLGELFKGDPGLVHYAALWVVDSLEGKPPLPFRPPAHRPPRNRR